MSIGGEVHFRGDISYNAGIIPALNPRAMHVRQKRKSRKINTNRTGWAVGLVLGKRKPLRAWQLQGANLKENIMGESKKP